MDFFISENSFRVFLPEVQFIEKSEDAYNSRQIRGIMSSQRIDRQGENVIAKGLSFSDFLQNGHFNDNHSQETSAIVGYPEHAEYLKDLSTIDKSLKEVEGWVCRGYLLKGTKRAESIWELAKALQCTPNKRLGFSIEGKVERRKNKTIEKANIRNVAITNSMVNTDCQWNILEKSFYDETIAQKAMTAGYGVSPQTQSNGGAMRVESLEQKKDKRKKLLTKALEDGFEIDGLIKSMDFVLSKRPDFNDEAAAFFVIQLLKKGAKYGYHSR